MIADVALPIPVGKYFSYSVPDHIAPYVSMWSRVRVPFHQRDAAGIITGLSEGDLTGLKPVTELLDLYPLVSDELASLVAWASSFYLSPLGLVIKYALPPVRDIERYLVAESGDKKVPLNKMIKRSGRPRIIDLVRNGSLTLRDDLTSGEFAGVGQLDSHAAGSPAEAAVLIDSVENRLARYVSLIGKRLENDGNVLFLLPDHYAAGEYFTQEMKRVYGDRVLWYSSGVPVRRRMEAYFKLRNETGHIILGNKNAVFLPARNLSLIIAERYDDDEYRNEESFRFNAVRTALERARIRGIPVVLGGAACSVDMTHEARKKGLAFYCHEWAMEKTRDSVRYVSSRSSGELLDRLSADVEDAVRHNRTIAVYVPRKEYGSYIRCQACREDLLCEKCGASLDYVRDKDGLTCTGCGNEQAYVNACPHCGSNMIGFARIGASFVHEHLSRTVPSVSATLITGDSLKKELSVLNKKGPHNPLCLVGTQVLSKLYGHHFDKLILVSWEELRKMSGFRSEEKTHQVLLNLIDALTPDDIACYTLKKKPGDLAAYLDTPRFYESELRKRKEADFPPFTRMFIIEARAKTRPAADRTLAKINKVISENSLDHYIFGTMPHNKPPFHSWRILLKGPPDLLTTAFPLLYSIPGTTIDPDPPSF